MQDMDLGIVRQTHGEATGLFTTRHREYICDFKSLRFES